MRRVLRRLFSQDRGNAGFGLWAVSYGQIGKLPPAPGPRPRAPQQWLILAVVVLAAATGCESLQRKFTRKPKGPVERPAPIINFQDYTAAMTPLDRYRKHFLIYDYWNGELLSALRERDPNSKRIRRASTESLEQLKQLEGLLHPDAAARFSLLVKDRAALDQRLEDGNYRQGETSGLRRALERQHRQIHREFFWRDVEDQLTLGMPDEEGA